MKPPQNYDWDRINPIFHSELSSSYMLYDIFSTHRDIASLFIKQFFGIDAYNIQVKREYPYKKIGSIDIFMNFLKEQKKKFALFIEVKVHDYGSAKSDQISRYCYAGLADESYKGIYFLYLTQFTEQTDFIGKARPVTLIEESRQGKKLLQDHFSHISWEQLHSFLESYYGKLTAEQQLIVSMQRQWILQKNKQDLDRKDIQNLGNRDLQDYFPDIPMNIMEKLPFGEAVEKNKRAIWTIQTKGLSDSQLSSIFQVIQTFSKSSVINRLKDYTTEEQTITEAKAFITEMAHQVDDWELASFYARLFSYVENTSYIYFYGTGTRGFSIKVDIQGKGEISLCTIYRNNKIEFSLKR